jgi:hypothetical protein
MDSQLIRDRDGKPIHALVPVGEHERLLRAAEDLADLAVHDAVKDQGTVPAELVHRIMDGENRVLAAIARALEVDLDDPVPPMD